MDTRYGLRQRIARCSHNSSQRGRLLKLSHGLYALLCRAAFVCESFPKVAARSEKEMLYLLSVLHYCDLSELQSSDQV